MGLTAARRLLAASHPAPGAAVTVFATVLAARAGAGAGTAALVGLAVLAGQLAIGWSNDRLDAARDRATGRTDKPVARGDLPLRTVDAAVAAALVVTVVASLALGPRAGLLHLAAVACGLAYDVGLKSTVWSWAPFAAAFAALPAIATLALDPPRGVAWEVVTAAGLLGVAGHLTNALPDLEDDLATGVRGLPHRLGPRGTLAATGVALTAACVLLTVVARPGVASAATLAGVLVVTAAAGAVVRTHPSGRPAFLLVIALVALDLALVVAGPSFVR